MKIYTNKQALDAAVQVATIAVAGGNDDATLASHYVFRVKPESVEVLASNGKRTLASAFVVGATVEGDPYTFTVSGWRFRNWLQIVPDGDVTLNVEGAVTKAMFGRSTTKFPSLDASAFPFWDGNLAAANPIATIPATRLFGALSYVRRATSDDEARSPHLVAVEMRDGSLWGSDKVLASVVKLPGLEKSTLRIHRNEIASAMAFLGLKNFGDVEIIEHDRCLFLRRSDGAVLGISRWTHEFPTVRLPPRDTYMAKFSAKIESLNFALKLLSVTTAKDDTAITFSINPDESVAMTAVGVSGESEAVPLEILSSDKISAFANDGVKSFTLDRSHLESLIAAHGGEELTFHTSWSPKQPSRGFVIFRMDRAGDEFTSVVQWKTR